MLLNLENRGAIEAIVAQFGEEEKFDSLEIIVRLEAIMARLDS